MSVIGLQVLKNTNLEQIEKAFGRPNVKEYGVVYIQLDDRRYAQFFIHHSDRTPITKEENLILQSWLKRLSEMGNLERLQKLGEIKNGL